MVNYTIIKIQQVAEILMQRDFMDVKKADKNICNFNHLIKTESPKNLIENMFYIKDQDT